MFNDYVVKVRVDGDYACFTRPDLKVERMTYPCMTPDAARGVLDSILWKPEFKWHIRKIFVENPVKFASIKRNELSDKQGRNPIEIESKRAQRNSIILRDVSYVIEASIFQESIDPNNPPEKYVAMFNRRVCKGQCFRRPFLGCREFSAEFYSVKDPITSISEDIPIGSMLLGVFFDNSGKPAPRFFYDVAIKDGVLDCAEAYLPMLKSSHLLPQRDSEVSSILYDFRCKEETYGGVI